MKGWFFYIVVSIGIMVGVGAGIIITSNILDDETSKIQSMSCHELTARLKMLVEKNPTGGELTIKQWILKECWK